MAKSLSQMNMEEDVKANEGTEVSAEDVELAFRMTVEMMNEGGALDILRNAIDQSPDPAMVVGQFLAQMMGQLAEKLRDEFDMDPKIFLAKNGWLDLVLDYIEGELGYPADFSDQIYQQVLEVVKAAASTPDAPNNVTDPSAPQGPLPQMTDPAAAPAQPGAPSMGGM